MSNRTKRYGSGKSPFIGQSIIYPVPIPLDAEQYFGAALVGEDGQFYYSNGLEWLIPTEDQVISRPNALVPFTVDEQTQLRLTPYRSPAGIEQAGIIFEISVNGENFENHITRVVNGAGVSSYQIVYPEDGFEPGDVVLWRAAYVGLGGFQSSFSLPYRQTFPSPITRPSPLTRENAISGTVTMTNFESPDIFGYQYYETQIEFYNLGDEPGVDAPFHTVTSTNGNVTTIPVPPLLSAESYFWRGRYGGRLTSVSPMVYSEWSIPRTVFVGAASIILTYDLTLATNRTIQIPLGGGDINTPLNVVIDWGDGSTGTFTTPGIQTKTYGPEYLPNTVQVTVSGTMTWYGTDSTSINQNGLTRVDSIGFAMGLASLRGAFRNTTTALTFITNDVPETITDMSYMFAQSSCAADLRDFDVRNVTDMSFMFWRSDGVGPNCANWDVRSVTNVYRMFASSKFNSPFSLGNWLSLTSMEQMFVTDQGNYFGGRNGRVGFNQPINYWDVSRITSMRLMFGSVVGANAGAIGADFNQPLDQWNVSNVTDFSGFMGDIDRISGISSTGTLFNQSLNNWDVSSATTMRGMFNIATAFNQNLNGWNTSNVTDMANMFGRHGNFSALSFQGRIDQWNVSSVRDMSGMFHRHSYNQPLANWERVGSTLANVENMSEMFRSSTFNQPIGNWNVSSVTNMFFMFGSDATNATVQLFNQDIGNWNVGNVENMSYMFAAMGAGFGQRARFNNGGSPSINNWNTSKVTDMSFMFANPAGSSDQSCDFNQPIGNWDVSNVSNMRSMLQGRAHAFNQDISQWNLRAAGVDLFNFLQTGGPSHGMSQENYSRLLTGWANKVELQSGPFLATMAAFETYNATQYQPGSRFTNAVDGRAFLVRARSVVVTNAGNVAADGDYVFNSAAGTYVKADGWYFLKIGNTWGLYNPSNVLQASGDGNFPWNVVTWTSILAAATVLNNGAAWTITGDAAA